MLENNNLIYSIASRNKFWEIGFVDIGDSHKKWLFGKKLFFMSGIKSSMKAFIETSIG